LLWITNGLFIDIILKVTFFDSAVRETHHADSVLNATDPLAFVAGTISPLHFSVAVTFVILVTAVVNVAGLPSESADAALLVVCIVSLKLVAEGGLCLFPPLASAVLHATLKLTNINA